MHNVPLLLRAVLAALVITAAVYDIRFRRIPNWLNLSGMILGFGLNAFFFQMHGTVTAGLGLLCAVGIYMPLYLLRGMGAGDVKLMAALGSLVGPANWLLIFVATALVGGAAAAVYAILKGRFTSVCLNLWFLLREFAQFRLPHRGNSELDVRSSDSLRMPHGVLIALGSLLYLLPLMPRFGI